MRMPEGERTFSNPNYRPEEWSKRLPELINGSTGVHIIDAANNLRNKIDVDSLTGCFSRQHYENLKLLFDSQRTRESEIALIFIDLNGLKNINDTFGHTKGDEVICLLGYVLKINFRKGDEIIRLGGNEFLIYCRNHDNDPQFKENLQKKIDSVQENFKIQLNSLELPSNGFAAGVAVFDPQIDISLDDLYRRSDQSMYENKESMKKITPASDII